MQSVWWRVAWRNLWRNRGRTLVTASGLAFGYLSAVVMVGLMDGMNAMLIENGTRLLVSQIQIHADDYLPERNMHRTIGGYEGADVDALLARIEGSPDVVAATPRLFGGGLISSGDQTQAALLLGMDPEREARVSRLLDRVGGRLPRPGALEILVGAEMARQLELSLGDELVVVAPAADGSMGNDLFTLVGTVETGTPGLDANYAYLPLPDLQYLLAMEAGRIHEVAVTVTRPWDTEAIMHDLQARLDDDGGPALDVRDWARIRPELAESVALMDSMYFIIVIVIFGMAVFGVANTMIIGTFERQKEFAVVRALGTTAASVGRTVVYEGFILGALSLAVGAALTLPVMVWWHNDPPSLAGIVGSFSWAGSVWEPVLRVEYSVKAPVMSAVALFLTSVFAAVYPAWKATRVPPADALADR